MPPIIVDFLFSFIDSYVFGTFCHVPPTIAGSSYTSRAFSIHTSQARFALYSLTIMGFFLCGLGFLDIRLQHVLSCASYRGKFFPAWVGLTPLVYYCCIMTNSFVIDL